MSVLGSSATSAQATGGAGSSLRLIIAVGLQKFPVKTTDDRTLSDVLNDFLLSRPDIPASYRISPPFGFKLMRNKNINLPMSLPIRMLANITMNSILMLISIGGSAKKELNLKIALAFESSRLEGEFSSKSTLWDVLVLFEKDSGQNFTSRVSDEGEYISPSIVAGSVKYDGFATLKTKKLEALGVTQGGVLFRLTFEPSGMALETVLEKIKEIDNEAAIEAKESEVDSTAMDVDVPPLEVADAPSDEEVDETDPFEGILFFGRVERCVYSLLKEIDSTGGNKEDKLAALKFVKGIVANIIKSQDEKFRVLKIGSDAFYKRLGRYSTGLALLQSVGFEVTNDSAMLNPSKEDRDFLNQVENYLISSMERIVKEKPKKKRVFEEEKLPVQEEEDVIVEPDLQVFREHVTSASLPHPKLFVENDPNDISLLKSAAAGNAEKAKFASSLVSKQYLREHNAETKARFEKVRIRWKFSDKIVVQANFSPKTSITDLFLFLQNLLIDQSVGLAFKVPPSTIFDSSDRRTLSEASLAPACAFLVIDPASSTSYNGENCLKAEILDLMKSENEDERRYQEEASLQAMPQADESQKPKRNLKSFVKL